jgi:predicted small secreted protein
MKKNRVIWIGAVVVVLLLAAMFSLAQCNRVKGHRDSIKSTTGIEQKGSAASAITPGDNEAVRFLTNNYWVFEFYVIPMSQEKLIPARQNKGMWYQFSPNGTYIGGQWGETKDEGTWFIRDAKIEALNKMGYTLFIDSAIDDNRDIEWIIQGISKPGDMMSWVKNVDASHDPTPGAAKVISMLSMPSKDQFGITQ